MPGTVLSVVCPLTHFYKSVNLPMVAKLVGSEVGIRTNPAARLY